MLPGYGRSVADFQSFVRSPLCVCICDYNLEDLYFIRGVVLCCAENSNSQIFVFIHRLDKGELFQYSYLHVDIGFEIGDHRSGYTKRVFCIFSTYLHYSYTTPCYFFSFYFYVSLFFFYFATHWHRQTQGTHWIAKRNLVERFALQNTSFYRFLWFLEFSFVLLIRFIVDIGGVGGGWPQGLKSSVVVVLWKKIKHTFNSTISLHIDSVTHERETRLHVPLYRTAYRSELTNEKSRRYFCFRIFAVCIQITFGAELSIFISLLSFGIQFERYASISLSLFLASSFHLLSLYINRRHRAHNLFAFRFGIFSSTIACLFEYFM